MSEGGGQGRFDFASNSDICLLLPHRELTKMETSAHHQSNLTAASEDQKHRTGVSAEGGSDERDPARQS